MSNDHWEIDFGKICLMFAALAGMTVMGIMKVVDGTVVVSLYTLVVGFCAGNGQNAIKGIKGRGMISRTNSKPEPPKEKDPKP